LDLATSGVQNLRRRQLERDESPLARVRETPSPFHAQDHEMVCIISDFAEQEKALLAAVRAQQTPFETSDTTESWF
jgi:hypothetical protein